MSDEVEKNVNAFLDSWQEHFFREWESAEDRSIFEDYRERVRQVLLDIPETASGEARDHMEQISLILKNSLETDRAHSRWQDNLDRLKKLFDGISVNDPQAANSVKVECDRVADIVQDMLNCDIVVIAYRRGAAYWKCVAIDSRNNEFEWVRDALRSGALEISMSPEAPDRATLIEIGEPQSTSKVTISTSGQEESFCEGSLIRFCHSPCGSLYLVALGNQNRDFVRGKPTPGDKFLMESSALIVGSRLRELGPAVMFALVARNGDEAVYVCGNLTAFKEYKEKYAGSPLKLVRLLGDFHFAARKHIAAHGGFILHVLGDTFVAAIPGHKRDAYAAAVDAARSLQKAWSDYRAQDDVEAPTISLGISGDAAQVCSFSLSDQSLLAAIGGGISNARLLQRYAGRKDTPSVLVDRNVGSIDSIRARPVAGWERLRDMMAETVGYQHDKWPQAWMDSLKFIYELQE